MSWKEHVKQERREKDDFLENHPRSPIPRDEREEFDGLDYFPLKEDFRFELELHEHDDKETRVIGTSTGGEREYTRWGEFRFEIGGEEYVLQAYKSDPDEERLWIPFKDETNGEETYGMGRYLDLEEKRGGKWVLDFNQAYNPFCAYSENYECALIPQENHLDVRIEAGEKSYH
ncbi:MAG: DUF1684 domain-containing protein [Candidatus Nanohaloarchaea archaeon]